MKFKEIYGTTDEKGIWRYSILKIRALGFIISIITISIVALLFSPNLYKYIGMQPYPLKYLNTKDMIINISGEKEISISLKNNQTFSTNEFVKNEDIILMLATRIPLCKKDTIIDNMLDSLSDKLLLDIKNIFYDPFLSMDIYSENKHFNYSFFINKDKYYLKITEILITKNEEAKEDYYSCKIEKNDVFIQSIVDIIPTN
jgi:hypothetical protein